MDVGFGSEFLDNQTPASSTPTVPRQGGYARGGSNTARSSSVPSQSQAAPPHKVQGPNWTEAEMLVIIDQKHIEWDGRHNSNQPSLAKFVYGTTAWKLILAGCMSVVGFWSRDADQITNKWDGLIKDYKKIKEYIERIGSANWWGMSRDEKKELSRTRKMSLEFSESIYTKMESFVGKRQIFGRTTDVVDSDKLTPPVARHFGRSPPTPCASYVGIESPATSAATTPESPTERTPGDNTPGSTGRKRKAVGTDNLIDFVKDFNCEYLACAEEQDKDKRIWRSEVLALDTAREARIAQKEAQVVSTNQNFYELEVERIKFLGNMTNALLMLASSMDALRRFCILPSSFEFWLNFKVLFFSGVLLCNWHFEYVLDNLANPPLLSFLLARLFLHSQGPLALGVEKHFLHIFEASRCYPLAGDDNPPRFDPMSGLC